MLKTHVWLPAKKTYAPYIPGVPRRVTQREPLSPTQAKGRYASHEKRY